MLTYQQHIERKQGVTGSDIAAIHGLSKWKTAVDVYLEKITPHPLERDRDEKSMSALRRGSLLEPLVREIFNRESTYDVKTKDSIVVHDKYSWLRGNIDGFITEEKALVEIKTASNFRKPEFGRAGFDEIPEDYLCQIHHYLNVIPLLNICYVPVLFGDEKFLQLLAMIVEKFGVRQTIEIIDENKIELDLQVFKVKRNKGLESALLSGAGDFWHSHVLPRVAPEARSFSDIRSLFPASSDESIVLTPELRELIDQRTALMSDISHEKNASKTGEKENCDLEILKLMKDASWVRDENGNSVIKRIDSVRESVDISLLKEKFPDVYKQCLRATQCAPKI